MRVESMPKPQAAIPNRTEASLRDWMPTHDARPHRAQAAAVGASESAFGAPKTAKTRHHQEL